MEAAINLDEIVQVYNAIRDARTVKRHAWEAEDELLEADQQKVKAFLLDRLNQNGAKSIATEHGTVYRIEKVKPSAADWSAIQQWIIANDAWDLMERRLKSTFVKQYMDENAGQIPPGVNVHREFEVVVRRANNSSGSGGPPAEQDDQ